MLPHTPRDAQQLKEPPVADMLPLTPDPVQMHVYITMWETHIRELEKELVTRDTVHREEVITLTREVDRLSRELATRIGPLEQSLQDRDRNISTLNRHIDEFKAEQERLRVRLAAVLETQLHPRLTIDRLLSDLVGLIEETKTQFRQTLTPA